MTPATPDTIAATGLPPVGFTGTVKWYRRKWLAVALVFIAILIPVAPEYERPGVPMDEGALLVMPEQVLQGKVPYRDFETFYGPANVYLLAGAYAAFGTSVAVERSVGLIYRMLAIAAIFALLEEYGLVLALCCAALANFVMMPLGITAFAWMAGIASGLWSLYFSRKQGGAFVAGLLAGVALSYCQDLAPAVFLSGLPIFLLRPWRERRHYLAGAAVGLLPIAAMLALAGPRQLLIDLFIRPVFDTQPARHLPLASASYPVAGLFALHVAAAAASLAAGARSLFADRKSRQARLFLAAAIFGAILIDQALQRFDSFHVALASFTSIAILPASLCLLWRRGAAPVSSPQAAGAMAAVLIAICVTSPMIPGYFLTVLYRQVWLGQPASIDLTQGDRTFPMGDATTELQYGQILDRLADRSHPGQRLFVGPADLSHTDRNDEFLYFMMPQLVPATYFLEMNPASADRPGSRLAADIASADWLVLNHLQESPDGRPAGSNAAEEVVRKQFKLVFQNGALGLFERRGLEGTKAAFITR